MSIVLGSLLGDGCLHTAWAGTSKNYRFAKTHSVKQKAYVNWVYKKLHPFVLTKPALYKPVQSLKVRTISHPELTELWSVFYQYGKKILPENIESIVREPLALAVWFMDDGNAVIRGGVLAGYHLNTQSFSLEENERIKSVFAQLHGIHTAIEKNKRWYRLGIWGKDSRSKFADIVNPHMIPSMRYKLG
jgi:recombination protein RecA